MSEPVNPWTTLSRSRKYENDWILVDEHQVRDAAGCPSIYGVVHNKQLGTQTIPVDDEGCIHLVGQFRYALGCYSWEFPAGGGALDRPPLETAQRELREETGFQAGRWLELLRLTVAGSLTDSRVVTFVAWELRRGERHLDRQEVIRVRRVPFAKAVAMALGGEIADAVSAAAVLALKAKLDNAELPEDLAALLR